MEIYRGKIRMGSYAVFWYFVVVVWGKTIALLFLVRSVFFRC